MLQRTSSRACFNRHGRTGRLRRGLGSLRSCAGFTLTEMIVIIVMVGVLATTAGVKWETFGASINLRLGVDQVAADLRFLQARAMASLYSTGTVINVATFPAGANTYNLGGDIKSLPSGWTINSNLTVTFNSLGECNTTTNATLTPKSGSYQGSVQIYATSGDLVRLY